MDLNLCRLCLKSEGNKDVFLFQEQNEKALRVVDKINYCCPNVNALEGDGLPSRICSDCDEELTSSYNFVIRCEATDKFLHSYDKIKVEDPDENTITDNEEIQEYYSDPNIEYMLVPLDVKEETEPVSEAKEETEPVAEAKEETEPVAEAKEETELLAEAKVETEPVSEAKKNNSKTRRKYVRRKHVRHRTKKIFNCTICGCSRTCQSALAIHMRVHTGEYPYKCTDCDKKYKDTAGLKRHRETKHFKIRKNKNFICEHCGKGFYSKNDIKIHMRVHSGEQPYSCADCPMKFSQLGSLQRHKKTHTGERPYPCKYCTKSFCRNYDLKIHLQSHSDEKNFMCSVCSLPFKYMCNLRTHMQSHYNPQSFVCDYCGRLFNRKIHLQMHISRMHSGKSGHCDVCSKNVSNIEKHSWKHTGKKPLKCKFCDSSFNDNRYLTHHVRFKHKCTDKYKCTFSGCDKSFPSQPMLTFHVCKYHESQKIPYPCDKCTRGFYRKSDLARHKVGTHKEKLAK